VKPSDLQWTAQTTTDEASLLASLLAAPPRNEPGARIEGVVIGELLALADEGATPLVRFAGQAGAGAVRARAGVDLHGVHVGGAVVILCEQGDPLRPIVVGTLRDRNGWPLDKGQAQVEVDVDGDRMVVSAREQLVLRCGKARITLTKAGKVLIEGTYVSSRSSGMNRVKGAAIQLN
jgi:Domain of unknown function (DUF6484)